MWTPLMVDSNRKPLLPSSWGQEEEFTAISHPINPEGSGVEITMDISLNCYNPLPEF